MTLTIPETKISWVRSGQDWVLDSNLIKGRIKYSWLTDSWIGVIITPHKSFRTETDSAETAVVLIQKIIPELIKKKTEESLTLPIQIQS